MNKLNKLNRVLLSASIAAACTFGAATTQAEDFDDVRWSVDRSNSPEQDKDGSGRTPSARGATNNQDNFRFEISTTRNVSGERYRQEFRFENRSGLHRFTGEFRISSAQPNFDRVSVAQTHDEQNGSVGVFSIYSVRRDGNNYVFGAQGDTSNEQGDRDSNSYSNVARQTRPVEIELDTWYRFRTSTSSTTIDDTIETAELFRGSRRIWTHTFEGGGQNVQYKKAGAYRLTGGSGRVIVDWREMVLETGR